MRATPRASEISRLRRTAKWSGPLEEFEEEDDLLTQEELKLFQSVAASYFSGVFTLSAQRYFVLCVSAVA